MKKNVCALLLNIMPYAAKPILMAARPSWEACICSEMRGVHVVKRGVRLVVPFIK